MRPSRPLASSFLPPFPRGGFASRRFRRRRRHRYYEGSDSCRPHPGRQVSPLAPPCRPGIPSSTTRAARRSLCQSPQRQRLLPGFATNEQARHSVTPNQVRHPTDCRSTSGCSTPRLAATQLPSIAEPATGPGTDFHRADKASSRTHSFPRKRESRRPKPPGGRGEASVSRAADPLSAGATRRRKPHTAPSMPLQPSAHAAAVADHATLRQPNVASAGCTRPTATAPWRSGLGLRRLARHSRESGNPGGRHRREVGPKRAYPGPPSFWGGVHPPRPKPHATPPMPPL